MENDKINDSTTDQLDKISSRLVAGFKDAFDIHRQAAILKICVNLGNQSLIKEIEVDTNDKLIIEIRVSYREELEEFLLVRADAGGQWAAHLESFLVKLLSIPLDALREKGRIRDVICYSKETGIY